MVYGSMEAVADKMKAATEEEIPYDNTDLDNDVVSGKRKPIQTERGAEYQRGMLKAQHRSKKASVVKQINFIKGLLQEPDSKPTIASIPEVEQKLDGSFHGLLDTVSRVIRDSDTPKEELDELSRDIEDIDASIFATKKKIS